MNHNVKKFILKPLKILAWLVGVLLFLILLLTLSTRLPFVQEIIKDKLISFYTDKTRSNASLGSLYVNFPSSVEINGLYLEDLSGDTLVYAEHVNIRTDLLGLLQNKLLLQDVSVRNIVGDVHNTETDSTFNYQFIIDAFTSSGSNPPADTAASPFQFGIYGAEITRARVKYTDAYKGMELETTAGYLLADASEFDLIHSRIYVNSVQLNDASGFFRITKDFPSSPDTESDPFYVNGEKVFISNVDFTFEDVPGGIRIVNEVGQANIRADSLNIVDQIYDAREITLLNTYVSIDLYDTGNRDTTTETDVPLSLLASSEDIILGNVNFRFYDHSQKAPSTGFDPYHMWFQQVDLRGSGEFRDGYAQGNVQHLSATENNGFVLRELSSDFLYGASRTYARSLYLETSRSLVEGDLEITYDDIAQLAENPGQAGTDLDISSALIDLRDVTYFVPGLKSSLPERVPDAFQVRMRGKVAGKLGELSVDGLDLRLFDYTRLALSGELSGLPEFSQLRVDIPDLTLRTILPEITKIVPDSLYPAQFRLPDTIALQSSLKGGISDMSGHLTLLTSLGDVMADLKVTQGADSVFQYDGKISTKDLEAGSILRNPDLGAVTMSATVKGKGLQPNTMETELDGNIQSVEYMAYTYDTIRIAASFTSSKFNGIVQINDPNLDFDFNGDIGFSDSVNNYAFDLDIKKADLMKLNLYQSELQLVGGISSRMSASGIDDMNGFVHVQDLFINSNNQIIPVDSLYFQASSSEDSTAYHLFSGFIEADFAGTFRMSQLPSVIRQHFSKYYELSNVGSEQFTELGPQSFSFDVDIKDPRIFTQLVPDLTELQAGEIHGEYNSSEWIIDLDVDVIRLVYGGIEADSLFIGMESDESVLNFSVDAAEVISGPVSIRNIFFSGDVESDNVMATLRIQDDAGEDRYLFGGIFISLEDHYRFMFTPGKFITNYEPWDLKPSNSIDIYATETWVSNLFLTQADQEIRIFSEVNDVQDSVLHVDVNNLKLEEFGQITQDSVPIISGLVKGESVFNLRRSQLAFTSDMTIGDFSFKGDTLGDISLQGDTRDGYLYSIDMGIQGRQNDIRLAGTYEADSIGRIDLDLNVNRLALQTTEAFAAGYLEDLEGDITGNIKISGNTARPDFNGRLMFSEVQLRTTYLGSLIRIDGQEITVDNSGLRLDDFRLTDAEGDNTALNGVITTRDFLVYTLDLDIRSQNFKVINRPLPEGIPPTDGSPYFGNLDVTSDITVRGTSLQPKIDMSARFSNGSSFAYVIPEETLSEEEQKDVVEWFDQDVEEITFFQDQETTKDSSRQTLMGVDLSARITLTPQNELTVVIDPITGDRLTVRGNSILNYNIQPSGVQTMSGRFEVSEGSYVLNFYNLIRREFAIQEGSYILWTGDPFNTIMNVTAIYRVRATPIGVNSYQGKLEFLVYLDIGGDLLQPEISFRLGLAPDAPAPIQVEAWVNQQNSQAERVNRQVFGLLVFQTFFPDESYASAGNVNMMENTARTSVSRLLSSQLSRLSNQIQGIDLSIDIDSYQDYSAAGDSFDRTELELGVSKELFNERVVVKLAGNVDLEGNRSRQGVSDFAGDIEIEYKLTEDGRFRLLGFRNNDFDNLQGEIIRTGIGVIYVREYNAFRELFRKAGEREEEGDDK